MRRLREQGSWISRFLDGIPNAMELVACRTRFALKSLVVTNTPYAPFKVAIIDVPKPDLVIYHKGLRVPLDGILGFSGVIKSIKGKGPIYIAEEGIGIDRRASQISVEKSGLVVNGVPISELDEKYS